MTCADELSTKHYLGTGHGHDCVRGTENVLLGIFDSHKPMNGKLTPTSISRRQLAKGNISLARESFIVKQEFEDRVVKPKETAGDKFLGIARCNVQKLRDITVSVPGAHPTREIRGVCVIDLVEHTDFDAHAILKYHDDHLSIAPFQGQVRTVRDIIASDLVNIFNGILSIDTVFPILRP
jgi:hypothetical protein